MIIGWSKIFAQTLYVDGFKGRDDAKGSATDPFSSLEKAVTTANTFSGKEPVNIKIGPGIYVLRQQLEIVSGNATEAVSKYTLEAAIMPDDAEWLPAKMPVIQSVSVDNSTAQFPHCNGILISRNNVSIRGLKFLGNANPNVKYYYPVVREKETHKDLEVSQCYFIGEKNSAPIQGAIWAHGPGIHVDHSIFYSCKNALLLFRSISDLSVTNTIIYGSYEAAVWFGPFNAPFKFSDNIVTRCNYFWPRPENTQPAYQFHNSVISENDHYLGYYTNMGPADAPAQSVQESGVIKTGSVLLSEVATAGLPNDYLNMTDKSAGKNIPAGIFKNRK